MSVTLYCELALRCQVDAAWIYTREELGHKANLEVGQPANILTGLLAPLTVYPSPPQLSQDCGVYDWVGMIVAS